jgi:hypothetical protein
MRNNPRITDIKADVDHTPADELRGGEMASRRVHTPEIAGSIPVPATTTQSPADRTLHPMKPENPDIPDALRALACLLHDRDWDGDPFIQEAAKRAYAAGLPNLCTDDYHEFHNAASRAGRCVDIPQPGDIALFTYQWREAGWCGIVMSVAGNDLLIMTALPFEAQQGATITEIAYNMREPNPLWRICAYIRL